MIETVRSLALLPLFCFTLAAWGAGSSSAERLSPLRDLYRLDLLPVLDVESRVGMFSTYDRVEGNNDGFIGTFSQVRYEDGKSVLAEMKGVGCVRRIYVAPSEPKENILLQGKGEHIYIYLDGSPKPEVDIPLAALFSGELPQFPKPLVGGGLGGNYCYVPIPYRNGCKIVVDGKSVRFYQISYGEIRGPDAPRPFSMRMTDEWKAELGRAVAAWSAPGDLAALRLGKREEKRVRVETSEGTSQTIALTRGPAMVRAVMFKPDANLPPPDDSRLTISWDGAGRPAVDLPLKFFFCQNDNPTSFTSLLAGATQDGWYNFMPMPYRGGGTIAVSSQGRIAGTLRIVTTPLDAGMKGRGYFHAVYSESLPTTSKVHHAYLNLIGKGRYLGPMLATAGHGGAPRWLEGEEIVQIDGGRALHGTGSEEYFNTGWYSVEGGVTRPGTWPTHGWSAFHDEGEAWVTAAYRWHIPDGLFFRDRIDAVMEHGMINDDEAEYRSAAFFYYQDAERPPAQIPGEIAENSLGMQFRLIPDGAFQMGSGNGAPDEAPVHEVRLTQPYFLGACEVTQEQYEAVMGVNPSLFDGRRRPVENVSWKDAEDFCARLTEMDEEYTYRLPTEAEWERACRAGSTTEFPWGPEMDGRHAWFEENSGAWTHEVGARLPNAWGLYDMCGNVFEWCADWSGKYPEEPQIDPQGPTNRPKAKILRGGSWNCQEHNLRSSSRAYAQSNAPFMAGFRIVREVKRNHE